METIRNTYKIKRYEFEEKRDMLEMQDNIAYKALVAIMESSDVSAETYAATLQAYDAIHTQLKRVEDAIDMLDELDTKLAEIDSMMDILQYEYGIEKESWV